jgi:hypothetical protein
MPVPGPIITMGTSSEAGSLKVDGRTNTLTVLLAAAAAVFLLLPLAFFGSRVYG